MGKNDIIKIQNPYESSYEPHEIKRVLEERKETQKKMRFLPYEIENSFNEKEVFYFDRDFTILKIPKQNQEIFQEKLINGDSVYFQKLTGLKLNTKENEKLITFLLSKDYIVKLEPIKDGKVLNYEEVQEFKRTGKQYNFGTKSEEIKK